jgi:hypothetical protein
MLQRLMAWRLPALLAGLCLALAAVVAWQVQRPMARPPVAPAASSAAEATAAEADDGDHGEGFAFDDIESFAAVVERPLFHRTRRPVPVAEAAEAAGAETAVPFQLSGVLVAGRTRIALLRNPASARILRAEEGDTVEGWRIEAIRPQSVVVRSGQTREEMTLADRLAPSPARAPQGARKQGPPSFERGRTALPAQRNGAAAGRDRGEEPEE